MFEYQGWATIREAYSERNEDENLLNDVVLSIKKIITQIDQPQRILDLKFMNGIPRLWVLGSTNHKGSDWEDVYKLFEFIAEKAPGSYGLLSYWDDEDDSGHDNFINVYALKKGKLSFHKDSFLSPCIPTIEER